MEKLLSVDELREIAKNLGIKYYYKLLRDKLITIVRENGVELPPPVPIGNSTRSLKVKNMNIENYESMDREK